MRLAFVNHGSIELPKYGKPLDSTSIGIWCHEVATRLPAGWERSVYSQHPARFGVREETSGGVRFASLPVLLDQRAHGVYERARGLLGRAEDPRRPLFASPLYYRGYVRRVAADLRRRGCDVVHVHNFSQFVPVLRRALPDARIVLHMHCEWLSQLDPRLVAPRLDACDLVLGCSEHVVAAVRKEFPTQAAKCAALWNGVDLERFRPPAGPRGRGGGPHVLSVARLSPEKGAHVLLEAFVRLSRRFPEARLTLIGGGRPAPYGFIVALDEDPLVQGLARFYAGGEGAYAAHLRALVPPELAARVRFVPQLPQAELAEAFRDADVFAFPSVWNEPFGMPVAEAMAAGLPVVATRGGGLPEIVEHGRTGLLVERGDADGLAYALQRVLADPDEARRMAAAARARVAEDFSWSAVAQRLRERIERLVHDGGERRRAA